jgi:hypothetical protein
MGHTQFMLRKRAKGELDVDQPCRRRDLAQKIPHATLDLIVLVFGSSHSDEFSVA